MNLSPSRSDDHPQPSPARPLRTAVVRTAAAIAIVGAGLFVVLATTGCRTTEGVGRDVEALGDNVADSAERNKP